MLQSPPPGECGNQFAGLLRFDSSRLVGHFITRDAFVHKTQFLDSFFDFCLIITHIYATG